MNRIKPIYITLGQVRPLIEPEKKKVECENLVFA